MISRFAALHRLEAEAHFDTPLSWYPGAGKTYIASLAIDDLSHVYGTYDNIHIGQLFCSYRHRDQERLLPLLLSVCRQFLQKLSKLPDRVRELYNTCKQRSGARPSIDDVVGVLEDVLAYSSHSFIVVDALDECLDHDRHLLLNCLFKLQMETVNKLSLLAPTRFIPDILQRFITLPHLNIRASPDDIDNYVAGQMSRLPPRATRNPELCHDIQKAINQIADDM